MRPLRINRKRLLLGMLGLLTLVELAAGALSAVGAVLLVVNGGRVLAALGILLSMLALLMLFFGQRVAKDYAGAAGLVPYFLVTVLSLGLMGLQ